MQLRIILWFEGRHERDEHARNAGQVVNASAGGAAMPYEIKHNHSSGLIEVVYSGEVTASELHDAVCERIAIQKETGALGVLADASDVRITPSTLDLLDIPSILFPEQHADRRTLTALVLPEAERPKEMAKFLETAIRNRGWFMQVFEDRQSAVAWLMEHANSNKA